MMEAQTSLIWMVETVSQYWQMNSLNICGLGQIFKFLFLFTPTPLELPCLKLLINMMAEPLESISAMWISNKTYNLNCLRLLSLLTLYSSKGSWDSPFLPTQKDNFCSVRINHFSFLLGALLSKRLDITSIVLFVSSLGPIRTGELLGAQYRLWMKIFLGNQWMNSKMSHTQWRLKPWAYYCMCCQHMMYASAMRCLFVYHISLGLNH